jgi:hypothetical protein
MRYEAQSWPLRVKAPTIRTSAKKFLRHWMKLMSCRVPQRNKYVPQQDSCPYRDVVRAGLQGDRIKMINAFRSES